MPKTWFFRDALFLLIKNPVLFLPKLALAGLFGIGMILTAQLARDTFGAPLSPETAAILFPSALVLFAYSIILLILDTIVNALYPLLVKQYWGRKKLDFRAALEQALKQAGTIIPAALAVVLLFTLVTLPFNFVFTGLFSGKVTAGLLFSGGLLVAIIFVFAILFYWLYPVVVLRQNGVAGSLIQTISLSREHTNKIVTASLVPFSVSIVNMALAFFVDNPGALALFVLLRFVTAAVYTYHMVLNPTIYLTTE